MSTLQSYSFYRTEMRAAADLTATIVTAAVHMAGLPFGIDPKLLVSFLVKTTGETGTSSTGDFQIQGSADGSTYMDLGAAETQLTEDPGTGVVYIPDLVAKYYLINLITSASTSFDGLQVQGVVASAGYRVDGS